MREYTYADPEHVTVTTFYERATYPNFVESVLAEPAAYCPSLEELDACRSGDIGFVGANLTLDRITIAPVLVPIPEPETYALMLAGLGVGGVLRRRRASKRPTAQ